MKKLIALLAFTILLSKVYFFEEIDLNDDKEDEEVVFETFKKKFKRQYASETDLKHRKKVFKENLKGIRAHNKKKDLKYTLGVNDFTDLTWSEFSSKYLGHQNTQEQNTSAGSRTSTNPTYTTPPVFVTPSGRENEEKDWRDVTSPVNVVGAIKNQVACGSCWTFSATGAVESAASIFKNQALILSEQKLLDCSRATEGNYGCDGGWETKAMTHIQQKGIVLSSVYPYVAKQQTCKNKIVNKNTKYFIKSWSYVNKGPEAHIEALKRQPLTGSLYVTSDFQSLRSGIYSPPSCKLYANHAIVIVGYKLGPEPYFILRNSWGKNWGENGYGMISMAQDDGVCGFTTTYASAYPSF